MALYPHLRTVSARKPHTAVIPHIQTPKFQLNNTHAGYQSGCVYIYRCAENILRASNKITIGSIYSDTHFSLKTARQAEQLKWNKGLPQTTVSF
jgi:hypothetical protein